MFNNALIEVLGLDVRAVLIKHLIWFGATCHQPITLCLRFFILYTGLLLNVNLTFTFRHLIVNLFARMKPS